MSNALMGRFTLTGSLVADSALCIGDTKGAVGADITCLRDGRGRIVLPGTALAGVLKQLVEDSSWGGHPGEPNAAVSRIRTEDAVLESVDDALEIRDSVAINRTSGTAAQHMLHSREVVRPGSAFSVTVTLDVVPGKDQIERGREVLNRIASQLSRGITVGGATTRGLGALRLSEYAITWLPLAAREGFLDALMNGPTPVKTESVQPSAPAALTITIPWKQRSPLLVSVPTVGAVDARPRTVKKGSEVFLTVPGSSVKGVLRAHAERIVRTLLQRDAPDAVLDQFREDLPGFSQVFGRAPDAQGQGSLRGTLRCSDVLATKPLSDWPALLEPLADRNERIGASHAVDKTNWLLVDEHVAVSRWTGGASVGALFAFVAPWPTPTQGWEPMILQLDLSRMDDETASAATMLIAFVVRDLCEGWLSFGHGTTRGYGEVEAGQDDVVLDWAGGRTLTLREFFASAEADSALEAWLRVLPAPETDQEVQR